jgi:type I restriction enzyme S subunit
MIELGPLPEEWEVVPLEKLNSKKKINLNPANFPDEIFEYYSIPNYQNSKKPSFERGDTILSQKILLNNRAVLFGKLNPRVEKVWKVQSDTKYRKIGSTEWIPIFPDNEKVDSDFLYYVEWTKYVMPVAKTLVTGSTPSRQRVDPTSFFEIKIPLPPLPEQRAIAEVLSTVQKAKEKTDAVISATKELKKSLMKHLFSYGPVPVNEFNEFDELGEFNELGVNELQNAQNSKNSKNSSNSSNSIKLKETEIGLVPEEWDVVRLGDVAEQRKETTNPRDGDWKYVGLEHIDPGESHLKRYGFSNEVRSSKSKFYSRDILYGKLRPYLDKGVLVDFEGICSTDIIVIKTKEDLNETLLSYLVHISDFREYATKTMTGVNHPRTSWRTLSQFSIPLPPLPTQQKIASILSAVDKKIEAEATKRKSLDELFKSLLHNLMTGKLRVTEF